MKRLQKLMCVILGIMILLSLLEHSETMVNIPLVSSEIYDLNDNWVRKDYNGTESETVSLPYKEKPEKQDEMKPPEEISEARQTKELQDPVMPLVEDNIWEKEKDRITIFENTIPEKCYGWTLAFSSTNRWLRILIDQDVVYDTANGSNQDLRGIPSESVSGYVNIPENLEEGKIQIQIISENNMGRGVTLGEIQVAKRDTVLLKLLQDNLFNIACSIILLISSIVLILLILVQRISRQSTNGMWYLVFFGMNACLYYILQTQTISIFYSNQILFNKLIYIGLMLLPLILVLYYRRQFANRFQKTMFVLFCIVIINDLLQLLFQMAGIVAFVQTGAISHLILIAVTLTVGICLLLTWIREHRNKTLAEFAADIFLLIGGIADFVIVYYVKTGESGAFNRYGATVYALIMMMVHLVDVSKSYSASVEENARLLQHEVEIMEEQNGRLQIANQEAESARKEAIAANEAKGRFLANMSHEIRTPINAVLGMDAMILRESTEEQIKSYAMDIQSAGQTLLSLINDILDFSKIESGKMEIIPVEYDFGSMIHDIHNMISVKAEAKNLTLTFQIDEIIPSRLYGDDVRIRQVLLNILSNAVKYTKEGEVTLKVNGTVQGEKVLLYFSVEDTGIGIKEEDIHKLFTEFERIDEKKNRNIEGTGLGMNITMQLLSLMDSRLEVESVYGEGSKFSFYLEQKIRDREPIGDLGKRIHKQTKEYDYQVSFTAPDAKILVVDDNMINRKVFAGLLKQTQVLIEEAESGKECLELVKSRHYDLIFLDHMMPEMDGIETLHKMKEMEEYPCKDTPVVILTANAVSGAREMYLSEGFDDFLSKPVNPEKLERMVLRILPETLICEGTAISREENSQEEKKASTEDLPQIDGIDWEYAWMHLPDMELLKNTVKDFYRMIDVEADSLAQYYQRMLHGTPDEKEAALNEYRIKVHSMKNSAALIGIIPLAGMAKSLERAAKEKKADDVAEMTPFFLDAWRGYKKELAPFTESAEAWQEITDTSVIQIYLDMLGQAMENMDIDAADEAVKLLEQYHYPGEAEQEMELLKCAVTNLDSEQVFEQIQKLRGRIEM